MQQQSDGIWQIRESTAEEQSEGGKPRSYLSHLYGSSGERV